MLDLLLGDVVADDKFLGPVPDARRLTEVVEVQVLVQGTVGTIVARLLELVIVDLEPQLGGKEEELGKLELALVRHSTGGGFCDLRWRGTRSSHRRRMCTRVMCPCSPL